MAYTVRDPEWTPQRLSQSTTVFSNFFYFPKVLHFLYEIFFSLAEMHQFCIWLIYYNFEINFFGFTFFSIKEIIALMKVKTKEKITTVARIFQSKNSTFV
mgnify:CR=1 FL=1